MWARYCYRKTYNVRVRTMPHSYGRPQLWSNPEPIDTKLCKIVYVGRISSCAKIITIDLTRKLLYTYMKYIVLCAYFYNFLHPLARVQSDGKPAGKPIIAQTTRICCRQCLMGSRWWLILQGSDVTKFWLPKGDFFNMKKLINKSISVTDKQKLQQTTYRKSGSGLRISDKVWRRTPL